VGLCGRKIATECFQEIAGFGTSLLLRVESFTGCKMAGGRIYAVSAGALRDAGIVEPPAENFLASLYKTYSVSECDLL
jgi:hypothetical protein